MLPVYAKIVSRTVKCNDFRHDVRYPPQRGILTILADEVLPLEASRGLGAARGRPRGCFLVSYQE